MTNGLTKSAKVEFLPPKPGVSGIPAYAERFYLTPAPVGMYYVREGAGYVLKTANSSGGTSGTSYKLPANTQNGVPNDKGEGTRIIYLFPAGAAVLFCYIDTVGSTTVTFTQLGYADANGVVPDFPDDPPADKILAFYSVATPSTPPASGNVYQNPAGTGLVQFVGVDTHTNGFPTANGTYRTVTKIPVVSGGTIEYFQTMSPTGPSGSYVPVQSDPLPQYLERGPSPYYQLRLVNFPGAPPIPDIPATPVFKVVRAWDAGANSIGVVAANDLFVKFQVGLSLGVKVGLYEDFQDRDPADASLLRAAFYCYSSANGYRWAILDDGRQIVPSNNTYNANTHFEIRRVGDRTLFLVDDEVVFTTTTKMYGTLRVGTAMYSTGDFVL